MIKLCWFQSGSSLINHWITAHVVFGGVVLCGFNVLGSVSILQNPFAVSVCPLHLPRNMETVKNRVSLNVPFKPWIPKCFQSPRFFWCFTSLVPREIIFAASPDALRRWLSPWDVGRRCSVAHHSATHRIEPARPAEQKKQRWAEEGVRGPVFWKHFGGTSVGITVGKNDKTWGF